ncbi:hypothetical protein [Sinomonas sp. P47F7]|uniref:hypothetical protein n=1 Tax=Sinomonas sp. P47F7 TaxID=3410987 RepID=UPI003BF57C5C
MSESTVTEFDGKCAFALSVGPAAKAPEGKPEHILVRDGKTYVFSAAVPKWLFQIIPGSADRAQKNWASN